MNIRGLVKSRVWALPCLVALAFGGQYAMGCSGTSVSGSDGGSDSGGGSSGGGSSGSGSGSSSGASGSGSSSGASGSGSSSGNGGEGGTDAAEEDSSPSPPDAGSCVSSLHGTYVVDPEGVAENEVPPETVVLTPGTAATPLAGVLSVQQQALAGCAVVSGGDVECWQEDATLGNAYGQLGNGTTTAVAVYRASMVLTAVNTPLTNVVSLASGVNSDAACAVTSEGQLWCWGLLTWIVNGGTELFAPYAQAVTVDGQTPLTGVIQAAVGYEQACAVLKGSPNSVWCWGESASEELGQGNTTAHQYPVKVQGLTSPTKVVLSFAEDSSNDPPVYQLDTACELDGDSVLCWGSNIDGATGGTSGTNPVPAPTEVVTSTGAVLSGVTDLEEGRNGFGVLRNDGTIWFWGGSNDNHAYASNYGVTNVVQLGWAGGNAGAVANRYLTSDGIYHTAMTKITPSCTSP